MARVRVDAKVLVKNPDNTRTEFLPREDPYVVTAAQANAIELAGKGERLDRDVPEDEPAKAAAPAKAKSKRKA